MPIRESGFESKLSSDKILEALKKLESEEQILAGLYFYESLSVEDISVVMQKARKEVRSSLNTIFTKISGTPLQTDKARIFTSDVIR
jgi:DNA-directed RNA polymerase specialized sigma24 family protein